MASFAFEEQKLTIYAFGQTLPMLLVGPAKVEYFRGNDVAKFLGYKQPAIAVTKHVRERHIKTLRQLEMEGIYESYTPSMVDQNELNSRWFTEPGLYRLIFKSHMPFATEFEDWVTEKVLPSIRKTGSYSLQPGAPTASENHGWSDKRLEGKQLMRLKNASLQQLIAGGFGQTGPKLYAIAANLINQAVLGFQETTRQFKKKTATASRAHQHSGHAEHAGPGGQVLCRDMLSQVHRGQPAALERVDRARAAHRVQGLEAQFEAGFCVNWHG